MEVLIQIELGGRIIGEMRIGIETTLQILGASIYEYLKNNRIVTYGTYEIRIIGEKRGQQGKQGQRGLPGGIVLPMITVGNITTTSAIEIIVPNDIYVEELGGIQVRDLERLIPEIDIMKPIKARIGNRLDRGLSKYV